MQEAAITIVGTGLAGYTLARELRKQLPDAPLRLISADTGDFYSKPMLSNGLASNKTPAQLRMKPAASMAEELHAELLTGTTVRAIVPGAGQVHTSAGIYRYSQLVLALGADSALPPLQGDAIADLLRVNDLTDYAVYRDRLVGKRHIALLGAGLIGCEFANDLLAAGYRVSVIDMAPWPLSRLLPEAAGQWLQARLAEAGAQFRLGVSVKQMDHAEGAYRLSLSDGGQLSADLVVSAIGLQPRIQVAAAAGLQVNRGIVVDRQLRSSDPRIYALGDCAEVAGLVLPYVMPIMHAARALAQTLAAKPTTISYPAMPVVVKTPSCPVVVAAPPVASSGHWQIEPVADGLRALYLQGDQLLGFALLGAATAERQTLLPRLPPVLAD